MREFNTSGPCDPAKHYTVMREALIAKGQVLVDSGRFFTIFAPRQSGKTTYVRLLSHQLRTQGYLPILVDFAGLNRLTKATFYRALARHLFTEVSAYGQFARPQIKDAIDLELCLAQLPPQTPPIILFIDEFETVPATVKRELLPVLRLLYHKRTHHKMHAVGLVGVSTLSDLLVESTTPFNIVEELTIKPFTFAEVNGLIEKYMAESRQPFDPAVVQAIYENTQGQPALTCAFCYYLVNEVVPDHTQTVTIAAFSPTLAHFLTERHDEYILNIVSKAQEQEAFMRRVLFGAYPIRYSVDDPNINYLSMHGVIANVNGFVQVPVPLYHKHLTTAFHLDKTGNYLNNDNL